MGGGVFVCWEACILPVCCLGSPILVNFSPFSVCPSKKNIHNSLTY